MPNIVLEGIKAARFTMDRENVSCFGDPPSNQ